jgi:Domain of Unknown Function (DUF928)
MSFSQRIWEFLRLTRVLPFAVLILFFPGVLGAQQQPPSSQEQPKPGASSDSGAATKNKHARVVTNLAGFDLIDTKKLAGQPMVVGATRGANPVVPLAPHLGKLYGAQPTFAWSYEDQSAKFTFVITDEADAEVFRAEVSGLQFRYPSNGPALQDGKTYFWTVSAPTSLVSSNSSYPSGILVVTTKERREIDKKLGEISGTSYEAGIARAQVLTDARLWYDALDAYTKLIERFPGRADLYERRGTIYAQLACTQTQAEDDLSRAEKAGGEK